MNLIGKIGSGIGILIVVILGVYIGNGLGDGTVSVGSVAVSNEYMATTTAGNTLYGGFTGDLVIRTGQGALGSVIITGANTGIVNFYNATTSNVLDRTGQKASSTILMASIPASAAAGTYTFDAQFTDGLLLELETGIMPTTTVTFR